MSEKTLTVAEAAKELGVSTVRVYGLIKQGRLRSVKEAMRDGRYITLLDAREVAARKGRTPRRNVVPQIVQLQKEIDLMEQWREDPKRHGSHAEQARGLARYLRNWVEGLR